jgi:ATP-dependent exoDNAse (exonuclease V), alpha subunit - helicase superfamily I member
LVTVIGHAAVISAGEWITASGEWINDRTHGQQFKAKFLKTSEPTSLDGIEKYLGSGMIRGIGPSTPKSWCVPSVKRCSIRSRQSPSACVRSLASALSEPAASRTAWAEQKIIREIMVFLHSNGVGTARAVRIFKTYGADAVQVMSENPIAGSGHPRHRFKTADAIA